LTVFLRETARELLLHEIRRIVKEADDNQGIVRASLHASELLRIFPEAEYSLSGIIDELIKEASKYGLPVLIDRYP
jgi:hypothetical protein